MKHHRPVDETQLRKLISLNSLYILQHNSLNLHCSCQTITPDLVLLLEGALRGGVKSFMTGRHMRRSSERYLEQVPDSVSVLCGQSVRIWMLPKHCLAQKESTSRPHYTGSLPSFLLAFASFSQFPHFEAAGIFFVFFPYERLTDKSRHVLPTELQYRLTRSMQSQSWRQIHQDEAH